MVNYYNVREQFKQSDREFINRLDKYQSKLKTHKEKLSIDLISSRAIYEMSFKENSHKQFRKLFKRFYFELHKEELSLN